MSTAEDRAEVEIEENQPVPSGAEGAAGFGEPADRLSAPASAHLLSTSVSRLNKLRAGVLGGNDGITSTAGLVVGVAATRPSTLTLAFAGLSGLLAGSLAMGGGEYASVRAQRDSQDALLQRQRRELETIPDEELDELVYLYRQRGLSLRLAREVAGELTAGDALAAHADAELGIDRPGGDAQPARRRPNDGRHLRPRHRRAHLVVEHDRSWRQRGVARGPSTSFCCPPG